METGSEKRAGGSATGRMLSLDAFRGLTIAAMILVNNPGTWSAVYPPLRHADWHGWTPTDFIFPFFLFIVGVSIALTFARRVEEEGGGGNRRTLLLKIVRRTLIIFALGLVLSGFPYYDLATLRIPGVLQRIAVCYFFASLIFLTVRSVRAQVFITAALLIAYWLMMTLIPVPGYGRGDLSMEGNLAAYLDRTLLAGHIYKPLYDPEGILSTIPAIATTLIGILTGRWLRSPRPPRERLRGMVIAGAGGAALGLIWDLWFPINKPLWTSSYVLFTAGLGLLLLALCYWLIEIKERRRWALPLVIFGVNALVVYFLSSLLGRLMIFWEVARFDGAEVSAKAYVYESFFAPWSAPVNASLFFAVCYVLVWLGLMTILYRRKIYIKV